MRRPWKRCPKCSGMARWCDPAWTCEKCGRDWTVTDDARFAPPGGSGPALFTCSYSEFEPAMGLGVRISVGTPRWIRRAEPWPYVPEVTPRPAYLKRPEPEFIDAYLAQLKATGTGKIREEFQRIAHLNKADRLVLLCFETLSKPEVWCHRRLFSSWWYTTTGQQVPELGEQATHEQLALDLGGAS